MVSVRRNGLLRNTRISASLRCGKQSCRRSSDGRLVANRNAGNTKASVEQIPLRHQILDAAFAAHESAKYELSIPVFLAQVEGMCLEVLGTKLFSTKSGVPVTRESTEALSRMELSEVLLLPLRELHGLTASKASRGNWPDAPNRHEILHGISTDYATPINSYKAISLLEYFCTFVAPRLDADWPRI